MFSPHPSPLTPSYGSVDGLLSSPDGLLNSPYNYHPSPASCGSVGTKLVYNGKGDSDDDDENLDEDNANGLEDIDDIVEIIDDKFDDEINGEVNENFDDEVQTELETSKKSPEKESEVSIAGSILWMFLYAVFALLISLVAMSKLYKWKKLQYSNSIETSDKSSNTSESVVNNRKTNTKTSNSSAKISTSNDWYYSTFNLENWIPHLSHYDWSNLFKLSDNHTKTKSETRTPPAPMPSLKFGGRPGPSAGGAFAKSLAAKASSGAKSIGEKAKEKMSSSSSSDEKSKEKGKETKEKDDNNSDSKSDSDSSEAAPEKEFEKPKNKSNKTKKTKKESADDDDSDTITLTDPNDIKQNRRNWVQNRCETHGRHTGCMVMYGLIAFCCFSAGSTLCYMAIKSSISAQADSMQASGATKKTVNLNEFLATMPPPMKYLFFTGMGMMCCSCIFGCVSSYYWCRCCCGGVRTMAHMEDGDTRHVIKTSGNKAGEKFSNVKNALKVEDFSKVKKSDMK